MCIHFSLNYVVHIHVRYGVHRPHEGRIFRIKLKCNYYPPLQFEFSIDLFRHLNILTLSDVRLRHLVECSYLVFKVS